MFGAAGLDGPNQNWVKVMKCPRCKCDDVYVSRSGNEAQGIVSFLMQAVRCHRCCYLFSVSRWTTVPKYVDKENERRAA